MNFGQETYPPLTFDVSHMFINDREQDPNEDTLNYLPLFQPGHSIINQSGFEKDKTVMI